MKFKEMEEWIFNHAKYGQYLQCFVLKYDYIMHRCYLFRAGASSEYSICIGKDDELCSVYCSKTEYNKFKSFVKKAFEKGLFKNNLYVMMYYLEN